VNSELSALVSLLDDPDPAVSAALVQRLESEPQLLDQTWLAAAARGQIPTQLTTIVLRADAEALVDAYAVAEDLEIGMWLLARLAYPRIDHRLLGAPQLDALAAHVAARITAGAPANAHTVARFLCAECGFSGNRETFDDPQNSFLPDVLERRIGLPIVLTALWQLVCRRLDLPCAAIALPGHVLGRWLSTDGEARYVDLFAGGAVLTRRDLDLRAQLAGEAGAEAYLAAASDRALLKRMARNLAMAYLRREDGLRATIAHALATV
jgi:regulator of sirC expression with transglutaminase-like and TPR domain